MSRYIQSRSSKKKANLAARVTVSDDELSDGEGTAYGKTPCMIKCYNTLYSMMKPSEKVIKHLFETFFVVLFLCVFMQAAQLEPIGAVGFQGFYVALVGGMIEFMMSYYFPCVPTNPFMVMTQYLDELLHGRLGILSALMHIFHIGLILTAGAIGAAVALFVTYSATMDYGEVGGPVVNATVSGGNIMLSEAVAAFLYGTVYLWGKFELYERKCIEQLPKRIEVEGEQQIAVDGNDKVIKEKCHSEVHSQAGWVAACNGLAFASAVMYAFHVSGGSVNLFRTVPAAISTGNTYGVAYTFYGQLAGYGAASAIYFLRCLLVKRFDFARDHDVVTATISVN